MNQFHAVTNGLLDDVEEPAACVVVALPLEPPVLVPLPELGAPILAEQPPIGQGELRMLAFPQCERFGPPVVHFQDIFVLRGLM